MRDGEREEGGREGAQMQKDERRQIDGDSDPSNVVFVLSLRQRRSRDIDGWRGQRDRGKEE